MSSARHMMHLRPRQARSKDGCHTCRRRRKKCDEEKPTCLACQRNKLTCLWPSEASSSHRELGRNKSGKSSLDSFFGHRTKELIIKGTSASLLNHHSPSPVGISESLSHFLKYTAKSLEELTCPLLRPIWKGQIFEDSKEFAFVASSLNAITSLHRARLQPSESLRHMKEAFSSRAASINEFRSTVSKITPSNASAVLDFAALQFVLCLDFPRSTANSEPDRIVSAMSALISALRGFWNLQPSTVPFVKDPYIRTWSQIPQPNMNEATYNPALLAKLECFYEFISSYHASSERTTCCIALAQLHAFFARMSLHERDWNLLRTWPGILPGEFIKLLDGRNPLALLITTYWCVPIFRGSGHWLLAGWDSGFPSAAATFISDDADLALFLSEALKYGMTEDTLYANVTYEGCLCHKKILIPHYGKNPLVDNYVSKSQCPASGERGF
ncbi:hypothetical protein BDV26DRAFT_276303 [Aspergillus bertholletiae]|uniref:Zn(2)-C6 fungal-type domain-containing protein n=1 Tax=Aspergillus bertholletiae TaxID=1226010 RepID=A0A5N7AQQ5_9EURO|nr:hypothetical protein BDV26DRAFT_276303 [Aspergillus bertholletiae]